MTEAGNKPEDIIFFIIDSDIERRNFYMSVCQMVRGVRVFGFEAGEDAAAFSEHHCNPDAAVVAYSLCGDVSGVGTVKSIVSRNPLAAVAVIADVYNKILEKEILSAGAVSCFAMSARNDSLLYAIKSIADIARSKRSPDYKSPEEPFNIKTVVDTVDITSYSSANMINKYAAAASLSGASTSKLLHIRVFSFLYDFFIKCFLNDIMVTAGIVLDNKRIIIAVRLTEQTEKIMKAAVFYFIAEKFIQIDDMLMTVTLDLRSDNSAPASCYKIKHVLRASQRESAQVRISALMNLLVQLSDESPLFSKFAMSVAQSNKINSPDLESAAVTNELDRMDTALDAVKNGETIDFTQENKLFANLLNLCIVIKGCRP